MDHENERDKDKTFKKREKPFYKKNHYKGKKNFYSKEEESSSNESSDSDEEEVLFLGIEEVDEHEEDSNIVINKEAKPFSTLDEVKRYKNKYRQLNSVAAEQKDKREEDEKEIENVIKELRSQIIETKKREECLKETL